VWQIGIQQVAATVAQNHRISLSAGMTIVNRSYNRSYFGVTDAEYFSSGNPSFYPEGGARDTHVAVRWNWLLTPRWMLSTNARMTFLQDDARKSPLTQRPQDLSVSTGLAYRF
jgi:outer membrane protein